MNDQEFTEEANKGFKDALQVDTGFVHGIDVRNPEHLILENPMEQLRYELLGGVNMKQLDRLRVTLKVARLPQLSPVHVHRNTVDLYNDNQIKRYIRDTAEKLEIGTSSITKTLYELIEGVEKYRMERRKLQQRVERPKRVELTANERTKARKLLKDPMLLNKVSILLEKAGLVGEKENGLLLFLIFQTRSFDHPLHGLIHGSSGSGKTNLLKTVIGCVPEEHCHVTTALTENVLFYPPYKDFWCHKVLMLEDLDGSMRALYSLRELMSNGSIAKFATEMDQKSGEHQQKMLEAKGPVCIVGATTKEKIYEDNSNRSYLIHVNESYRHQQAVMDYQNRMAAGAIDQKAQDAAKELLKNTQRLLERLEVRNPFQPELMLPPVVFKPLRTNMHYITLIKAITYFHQHQLEIQTDKDGTRYIETKLDHIEWANKLCKESLLRKSDQLTGAQRTFFERLKKYLHDQGITEKSNQSFLGSEARKSLRTHPQHTQRMFKALEKNGFVSQVNYTKKMGYEYQLLEWSEYEQIKNSINKMDDVLKELRAKYPDA